MKACATAGFVCNSGLRQRQILLEYSTITLKACATAGFVCNSGTRQRQILFECCTITLKACATAGLACNSGMRQRQSPSRILHDHVEGMWHVQQRDATTKNPSRILHDHVDCLCNSGIRVQQRDAPTTNPSRPLHDHVEGMCSSGIRVQQQDATTTKSFSNAQQRDSCATAGCDNDKILLEYCTITLKACAAAGFVCNSRMRQRQILLEYCTITLKECATAGFVCHSRMRQRQNPSRILHDHVLQRDSCATAGCDNDKSFSNTARSS